MKHQASFDNISFINYFEACNIPLSDFHHKEHIKLAYVLLVQNDIDLAYAKMKTLLQNYLEHNGVPPEKYHVTITRAWLLAVVHFMHKSETSGSSEDFISQNEILLDTEIMFSHYSRDLLFSDKARTDFVEPDLESIPVYSA